MPINFSAVAEPLGQRLQLPDADPVAVAPAAEKPAARMTPEQLAEFGTGNVDYRNAVGAAFRVGNSVGSALANNDNARDFDDLAGVHNAQNPGAGFDPAYDPFADIAGYEQFADSFIHANSPGTTAMIKAKIDREHKDRETIEAAGWRGTVAMVVAGAVDPIYLPLMAARPFTQARPLVAALKTGATGGGAATVQELALHATQETRTKMESAFNIGGATLLSGVLGGASSLLSRQQFDTLAKAVDDEISHAIDRPVIGEAAGAAARRNTTIEQETLTGTLGVAKATENVSPLLRTMQSPSLTTRQVAQELAESHLTTAKNETGIASPVAVETLIRQHDARLGSSFEKMDSLYVGYRTGETGGSKVALFGRDLFGARRRAQQMTFKEFREEIGNALRNNDTHTIPQVQQAAAYFRKAVFDPLKDDAIKLGMLDENVKAVGSDSYLSRVYKFETIKERRPEFRNIIADWVGRKGIEDRAEALGIADEVINNILGHPGGTIPRNIVPTAGPLKERTLTIPDALIKDFLESDIELIARHYVRSMAPEIELTARFGSKDMHAQLADIETEYANAAQKLTDPKALRALEKQKRADIRDLAAMRDTLLGTYGAPVDPDSFFVAAARNVRKINYLRMLGQMTVSSISDIANPIMVHGLRRYGSALMDLALHPTKFGMAADEVKAAGAAWDMVLNTRAQSLADIGDHYGVGTVTSRGLDRASTAFGLATLMTPWNAAMKQFGGVMTAHRVLQESLTVAGGRMDKKIATNLARLGIDESLAVRIAEQFKKHGDQGDVWLSNAGKWDDLSAARAFRAAVVKDVSRLVVEPGVADLPLAMHTTTGRLVGQFKSFGFASVNRILLPQLQQRDLATLNGTLVAVALGAVSYGIREKLAGKDISDKPGVIIANAVDRAGMLGYLMDVNNIMEKATRGHVGISALTGGPEMSRYASRNAIGALLGPTFGTAQDLTEIIGSVSAGEVKRKDVHLVRKLLPYQNLFYLRKLFDAAEDGAADALGIHD